ncbi:uncharacterized protein LOC130735293 [Lotus japonicus]|uniref:uncharacterized protein LOC130735293 n=1 Tax=Lotus japonicus TaxID=34305 RepID=UPI002587BFA0|nr:uncharacterized protein LOC130735293 [Lotus japonicus]
MIEDDIIWPTPIKLGDVGKMNLQYDDSEVPVEFLTKKRRAEREREQANKGVKQKVKTLKDLDAQARTLSSKQTVNPALRIAPFPEDEPEQSREVSNVRTKERSIKITKGGVPVQSDSNPVASRTRSGQGSPASKIAEPKKKKLKRLRKQFNDELTVPAQKPKYNKRKTLANEPDEPENEEDFLIHSTIAKTMDINFPPNEVNAEISNQEFVNSLFDDSYDPHKTTPPPHHSPKQLSPTPNQKDLTVNPTDHSSPKFSPVKAMDSSDEEHIVQQNEPRSQLFNFFPLTLTTQIDLPFQKPQQGSTLESPTNHTSKPGTLCTLSQVRKRRLQTLVSSAIKRRRTVGTSKASSKVFQEKLIKKIEKSPNRSVSFSWKKPSEDGYKFHLEASKVPDWDEWQICATEGYVGTMSYSLLNRVTALIIALGNWVYVLLPRNIPEILLRPEKLHIIKGKGKLHDEGECSAPLNNASAEEDLTLSDADNDQGHEQGNLEQPLEAQFVRRSDFEDHKNQMNNIFYDLASKIDLLLNRFG